ncbi:MAG: BatA and WFA domain-containing protein [Deinococcota bacterium]|jgi:hypothetical protein|nr:BatA and WFA domain-containing protein [Deinococcota bacterium]
MTFLAPQFLWTLLAVPLIVALHFVRTRRRKETVSALFLWQQAREAAQRKRRFSATWLLLLQLLFAGLAALALARPSLVTAAAPERVLVVDASASMAARDGDGRRLDKALEVADGLLRESGRVALVRAGEAATLVLPPTGDHGRVRQALEDFVAVDAESDLQRALELAEAVAPGASIHLLSDSPLPSGADARLHPVGGDGQNVGITAFELRGGEAFVAVTGNNARPESLRLVLERAGDGSVVNETTLRVSASSPAEVLLTVGDEPGFYRARLEVPAWDALELDNTAYAGSRALRVLQVGSASAVERALLAMPGVAGVRVVAALPAAVGGFDVAVLVGAAVETLSLETLPPGRYLIFAPPRAQPSYRSLIDWDRGHPLLRFVDLTGVVVAAGDEVPLPGASRRTLAQTDTLEPAIETLLAPGLEAVYLAFHPSQTDLVNRTAFPVLLYNVVQSFRGENRLPLGSVLPDGTRVVSPGVYSVDGQPYGVSLLSAEQTRLPALQAAPVVAEGPALAEGSRALEWALVLLALALVLLVGEWLLWARGASPWASRT